MSHFTAATQTIQSVLTDQGRDLLARSLLGQVSLKFSGFQAGRDGYQGGQPVWIIPPDSTDTQLSDPIHPLGGSGVASLLTIEAPFDNVVSPVCRLGRDEALYGIGEVGLFVRVIWMPDPAATYEGTVLDPAAPLSPAASIYTVGQDYLFALAHMPLMSKTDKTVMVFRFVIAV